MTTKNTFDKGRRDFFAAAGAAGLAGLTVGGPARASEHDAGHGDISVARNGNYETVPLRSPSTHVAAIQSRVRAVDVDNLKPTMKANMDHVVKLINYAQGTPDEWGGERLWGAKKDLVCLHEFPIQGFQPWTRKQLNRVALELPGPETERLGELARRHDCYIAFGCYAREQDWPDHVINMSVIIGPSGDIVSKQWKARNILGLFGENALIGTTVYDVLDEYVERYGWDATIPVARTDIGNICMTAVGGEDTLYLCQALKGAEILIKTVTGGTNAESTIATARATRTYCVGVGNAVSPDNIGFTDAAGSRDEGTIICDARGQALARSANHHEDIVSARIPIGDFRETRRFPELPVALLLPVLAQYEPRFKPNAFSEYLPKTYKEAGDLVRRRLSEG